MLVVLVAASCAIRPDNVLSNRQMERVLVDLHRAEGILQVAGYNYGHDSEVPQYYQVILERNGVTQAQFDSSIVWYTDHPAYFTRVYPRVRRDLQKLYDEEELRATTNNQMRYKRQQDSIFLQKEPPRDSLVQHMTWEMHRYQVRELYVEPEALEPFTAPILKEMKRQKEEEEARKAEENAEEENV